ncbi:sugar phosphate isomerase/epimerase family protein [Gulosibacter chungangensis]|uniref:Sugar phosphate isomerase/epimerase n=1 Tax=Gulosibacter chungangensis TaxID=979746 RepID=A0A7J5B777_9MICO|nr:sugar phosphate isomerase/epimerase [Gulosibacter chungangensis]KAB1640233.1 sugar phosphate isomerase/epimerase [Gulosibacter chungangensis]
MKSQFGGGSWSPKPHLDVEHLLSSKNARDEFQKKLADAGLEISALNASGNQLHPAEPGNDELTRDVVRVAGELGVETVVLMSGLPAGVPGDQMPNWITTSWPPETTQMLQYQWNEVALPYWEGFAKFSTAQGVSKLAVEMHANQLVYNVPSLLHLRREIGDIVGANFDPSHLMWMGADPLEAVAALSGAIYHVHAKDTRIEQAAAVRSRLEYLTVDHPLERSWNYVTVGRGNAVAFWRELISELQKAGYDDALSIEHEDAQVSGADGVREAAATLKAALAD